MDRGYLKIFVIVGISALLFIGCGVASAFLFLEQAKPGPTCGYSQPAEEIKERPSIIPKMMLPGAEDCFESHSFGVGNDIDYVLETSLIWSL
ncbi:MAG: hypothetical protein IKG93_00830 [Clostridiales bacterium]|nr:hypothetical protein [Clostridiales bacterium]